MLRIGSKRIVEDGPGGWHFELRNKECPYVGVNDESLMVLHVSAVELFNSHLFTRAGHFGKEAGWYRVSKPLAPTFGAEVFLIPKDVQKIGKSNCRLLSKEIGCNCCFLNTAAKTLGGKVT